MKTHCCKSVAVRRPAGSPLNRRQFLVAGATLGAAALVPRHVLGAGETPPSEKLNIAGIGVGGMGASNLDNLKSQNIVALCDVDQAYAAKTFKSIPTRSAGPTIVRCWRSRRRSRRWSLRRRTTRTP